jgi:hypothetical protein
MKPLKVTSIGFVLGTVVLGALTGCIVAEPRYATVYAPPPPVYVESQVVVQDDYVYYPDYQVYYSGSRHQYFYLEGRAWVWRPAPPHVSASALFASPSVRLDFHDSPSGHHAAVSRQYPKHWAPPASSHGHNEGHDEGNHRGHD